jgi:hypothetical protein
MDAAVLERPVGQKTWSRNETLCKKTPDECLWDIMKKASDEAKSNGYKPEMLEEILNDDDV